MDSWEKIEREIEADIVSMRSAVVGGPNYVRVMHQSEIMKAERLLDRLRALRERDEKRWEIVGRAETVCRANAATASEVENTYRWLAIADRLREAREGRDA